MQTQQKFTYLVVWGMTVPDSTGSMCPHKWGSYITGAVGNVVVSSSNACPQRQPETSMANKPTVSHMHSSAIKLGGVERGYISTAVHLYSLL